MIKKSLATTAMLGVALGAAVAAAPGASAATAAATATGTPAGTYCGATVPDGGVSLDACAVVPAGDTSTIDALVGIDSNGREVDPCAQLVDLDTGRVVKNYPCVGWINTGNTFSWYNLPAGMDFGPGSYVVEAGYWAYNAGGTLQYFGNVQSPRVVLG